MSRRKRKGLSPNLFPFLAVLVCTLGTLILLLALVAQKAEESAGQRVDKETEAARLVAEEERWEAEILIEQRRKRTEELDKRRSELAHVEDHARRLREELQMLKQEIEATEGQGDGKELEKAEARLVALRKQTESERDLIAELELEKDGKPPRVVIVPYKGTNGTDRRPIYVECTSTAVIIQPEGVRITANQLDGPMGPGNPLDAALRAVRSHWQSLDPNAPPPYPLLLVRPSGVHAYAASRIAMSTWDDQFGYELIPENLELAFPVKDPTLEVKLVEAVQLAVNRNRARVAGAPSKYPGLTPQRIAGSQRGGSGGTRESGFAAGTTAGTTGGTSATGSAGGTGSASRTGSAGGTGRSGTDTAGTNAFATGGSGRSSVTTNPYADVPKGESRGAGDFTIDGADLMVKRDGSGTGAGTGTGAGAGSGTGNGTAAGSASGLGMTTGSGSGSDAGTEYVSEQQFLGAATEGFDTDTYGAGGGAAGSGELANGQMQADASGSNFSGGEAGTFAGNGQLQEGQLQEGASSNAMSAPGAGGQLAGGQMSGGGAGSGSASQAQASAAGMSAAAMADPRQNSNAFNMPEQFDPHEKTFSETMENRMAQSAASRGSSSGAAQAAPPSLGGGNNWALPESMIHNRGASIVREMKLMCSATGYVLMPESAEQLPQAFPIQDGLVERSVLELAKAIRDRVERWGVAMQNGRWDPVLSVQVAEGGETRFRQLEVLLKNSGVRVEREVAR